VSTALRYRLFGMGKMPAGLADAAAGSEVLFSAEGISVKQTVTGLKMARASVPSGTKLLIGALVVAPERLLASLGSHPIVDTFLRETDTGDATLTLAQDGVRITLNVADVLDGASGTVEIHYRVALDPPTLAGLPSHPCPVSLTNAAPALLNGWKGVHSR
jgi:hypothetical protein